MTTDINELIALIKAYLNDDCTIQDVNQKTLQIIALDEFENLRSDVQDGIYALDNAELNNLTKYDVSRIHDVLVASIVAK